MRYKCVCSYDGSNFRGFQYQKGLRTVQSEIEKAILLSLNHKVRIHASGRTDTGVHAIGQVFHFDLPLDILPENLTKAINSRLPHDIYITNSSKVNGSFHARIDAKSKEYLYIIDFGEYSPIHNNYRCYCKYRRIDFNTFKESLKIFVGKHDFRYFSRSRKLDNTIREISNISYKQKDNIFEVRITGDGFLHHMIRIVIASALEVARGMLGANEIKKALSGTEPLKAPKKMPPNGLYLIRIEY